MDNQQGTATVAQQAPAAQEAPVPREAPVAQEPPVAQEAPVTLADQAPKLLQHVAGYIAHRTVATGLRTGLVRRLADMDGASTDELAAALGLDPFYVSVWARSAFAAGILERSATGYRLAPHIGTLLLDADSPAFAGGLFTVFEQDEMFGRFERELATGTRLWWDETSDGWTAGVAQTGRPFYTRLVPAGLQNVPGLSERLAAGGHVLDTACGSGYGLLRLAGAYPAATVSGVDGDAHSVSAARGLLAEAGIEGVQVTVSPLEELRVDHPVDVVVNNISMHECRDIDLVAERVREALVPGGWFVISDFPFPDTDAGLRTVPGRIMSGIQFFEAQIDDQLLPRATYDDLLERHGFTEIGSTSLTPVHALTWGRRA
ncbi:class I SAM-dependent methyltransferase [Georgenia subflava]|uniref:Methyltransferase domain-containing protein n=1 Tax=Georgenia subflava TaxID=1622177 RepID=A0A6N7EM28_9MICO|nr:class I SAM-dependent methyltransferase [Georgenia subflava]MPV36304.1 methyltransferase domain-containing protein [Georgenia subflava]